MAILDLYDPTSRMALPLDGPIIGGEAVTPNDSADLPHRPRAFMIATAGDVAVMFRDGSTMTYPALNPGVQYNGRFDRVLATGTTATGIVIQW